MTTFKEYTGTLDADRPLVYSRLALLCGQLRKPTKIETLEFSAAVATQAHLVKHYDEEPMVFLKTIQASIEINPGIAPGQKRVYLRHCKPILSMHVFNYLANQAFKDKVPSTISVKNDLRRLEFKWLLAKLYAEDLLEQCTYRIIQENCPELYCRRELVGGSSERPAHSVSPAQEELTTSEESAESSDESSDEN